MMSNSEETLHTTPYNDEELDHFKQLLKDKLQETRQTLNELRESADNLTDNKGEAHSAANHHHGNIASKEAERETDYKLIGHNQDKLNEIKAALDRIEQGTYGICEDTGKQIQKGRLNAIPYTKYSIEAEKEKENSPPTSDW